MKKLLSLLALVLPILSIQYNEIPREKKVAQPVKTKKDIEPVIYDFDWCEVAVEEFGDICFCKYVVGLLVKDTGDIFTLYQDLGSLFLRYKIGSDEELRKKAEKTLLEVLEKYKVSEYKRQPEEGDIFVI